MKKIYYSFMLILCIVLLSGCGSKKEEITITKIKERISKIEDIDSICVVTEDKDPNGNLNKQGGYTGALFFVNKNIDLTNYMQYFDDETMELVDSEDACDMGTSAGGSIEIYKNNKDASNRDKYLSTLDSFLSGGYHIVKDNIVIRISDDLTATEQKKFANKIIKYIYNK